MDMFDMVQHRQIRNTRSQVNSVQTEMEIKAKRIDSEVDMLEERLEKMRTLCEAMWQLVCETTGLTDEHLAYRLYELDSADGRRDGKKQLIASTCSACSAKINPRLKACQFCGVEAPIRPPWDAI